MQGTHSSNPPEVTGICDPNKSQVQHHPNKKNKCEFTIAVNT